MAENGIGDQFGGEPVLPLNRLKHMPGPGRRMIDPDFGARQPPLKRRRILSEIVEQPREEGRLLQPQRFGHLGGLRRHPLEMFLQPLPVALVIRAAGMRIVDHDRRPLIYTPRLHERGGLSCSF